MNIIICDDNIEFGHKFSQYINFLMISSDIYKGNYRIECFDSAEMLQLFMDNNDVDILFLDISMPGTDGFEVAKIINSKKQNLFLIFISNYEEKVYYSFRFEPFRFIRKSNYENEVKEALMSAIYKMTLNNKSLIIKSHSDITYIRIPNIYYIEKEKMTNYVVVFTKNEKYRYRSSISDLKVQLRDFDFLDAGQNIIINPEHIVHIDSNTIFFDNNVTIQISKKSVSKFKKSFLEYMRLR